MTSAMKKMQDVMNFSESRIWCDVGRRIREDFLVFRSLSSLCGPGYTPHRASFWGLFSGFYIPLKEVVFKLRPEG